MKGNTPTANEWALRAARDDAHIAQLLQSRLSADSNCIDIGAHRGLFLDRILKVAPQGRHIAIEPLPSLAEGLREKYPGVEVHCCALSNRRGRAQFHHAVNRPAWSGLKAQAYPQDTRVEMIEVDVKRLDDLIPDGYEADFIKIDVEGGELEVLEGGVSVLTRCKPLVLFEHAKIHNEEYGTTPEALHAFLVDRCGFGIFCLDGSGPLSSAELRRIYDESFASNYDRRAQTNFVAAGRAG